jgi:hypothetical protein
MDKSTSSVNTFYICEGVYPSFDAAAASGQGSEGDTYLEKSLSAAMECITSFEEGRPIP